MPHNGQAAQNNPVLLALLQSIMQQQQQQPQQQQPNAQMNSGSQQQQQPQQLCQPFRGNSAGAMALPSTNHLVANQPFVPQNSFMPSALVALSMNNGGGAVALPSGNVNGGPPAQVPPSAVKAGASITTPSIAAIQKEESQAATLDSMFEKPSSAPPGSCGYRDFSQVPPDQLDQYNRAPKPIDSTDEKGELCQGANFPTKLHDMLSREEFQDVIAWAPHGRSFRVLKPKAFESRVLTRYFRHGKYNSFMRQVNGWGFRRITQGPDFNSYYHEFFLRGLPHLCKRMRRGSVVRAAGGEGENSYDPDFRSMRALPPNPFETNGRSGSVSIGSSAMGDGTRRRSTADGAIRPMNDAQKATVIKPSPCPSLSSGSTNGGGNQNSHGNANDGLGNVVPQIIHSSGNTVPSNNNEMGAMNQQMPMMQQPQDQYAFLMALAQLQQANQQQQMNPLQQPQQQPQQANQGQGPADLSALLSMLNTVQQGK